MLTFVPSHGVNVFRAIFRTLGYLDDKEELDDWMVHGTQFPCQVNDITRHKVLFITMMMNTSEWNKDALMERIRAQSSNRIESYPPLQSRKKCGGGECVAVVG